MSVVMVAGVAPCHGEGEQPQRRAEGKGKRLEPLLCDIASEDSRQQQRGVRCGPLDGLKAPGQSQGLPLLCASTITSLKAMAMVVGSRSANSNQRLPGARGMNASRSRLAAAMPLARSK